MSESDKAWSPPGNVAQQLREDALTKAMIYQGCSFTQLSLIFGLDKRTVSKRLSSVQPIGKRGGFDIYRIVDAAPFLVKPAGDIGEYIRNMGPKELPHELNRAYWVGQREKMRFEEESGDLWRTDEVMRLFATAFAGLRQHLILLSDAVEREVEFTDRQRDLLKEKIDSGMEELRAKISEEFADAVFELPEDAGTEEDDDFWNVSLPDEEGSGETEEDDFHGL